MKDTAPISQGIIAVAALFAIIAAGVAFVLYDYGLFGSAVIGGVIGAIAAIALAIGWRAPAPGPHVKAAPVAAPAPEPVAAAPAPEAVAAAPAPEAAPAPAAAAPTADVAEEKPALLDAARDGAADDLKKIKGVGPGLEKTLNEMGIYHYDQIAKWTDAEVAWVDARLKFKGRIVRDGWIAQAKSMTSGG
jgi:NADH-quinone oxidoreductase subunit E